jgi:phosphoserine aminotransferase
VAGGAFLLFSAIPFDFLGDFQKIDYFVTGKWSSDAFEECQRLDFPGVTVNRVCPKQSSYSEIPDESTWTVSKDAAYFYFCSNETVHEI